MSARGFGHVLRTCISRRRVRTHSRRHEARDLHLSAGGAGADDRWVPLCERGTRHSVSARDLAHWRCGALDAIANAHFCGDGREIRPSEGDLKTELRWLLEDIVVGMRKGGDWSECGWRDIECDLQGIERATGWDIQLRLSLCELAEVWARRMQERVPFQYLTCTAHWRDLVLSVGPGVLIPRPETEQMIDLAERALRQHAQLSGFPWVDLGTGSGALAIALAKLLGKDSEVWGVDVSPTAVSCAAANAKRCGLQTKVHIVRSHWFQEIGHLKGKVGGILTNPPYIPRSRLANLQVEVGNHEPHLALDGGDGLGVDSLQEIIHGAASFLVPGGLLALETDGGDQASALALQLSLLREANGKSALFEGVVVERDCFGVARFVLGYRC